MTRHAKVALFIAIALLMCPQTSKALDDPAEINAVKDVVESIARALTGGNLEGLLTHFAGDAKIDSIAANGKVPKDRYRQAMADTFKTTSPPTKVEYRELSVTLSDLTHAVVTGNFYFQGKNWKREGSQEWRLEKRAGTWLIIDTTYTRLGKVENQ